MRAIGLPRFSSGTLLLGVRRGLATLTICVSCVVASGAAAQNEYTESIDVVVSNIDVVVTDDRGRPVTGLTKGEFELFEGGKRQTIVNFYEVTPHQVAALRSESEQQSRSAVSTTSSRVARRVVILIDDASMDPSRRVQLMKALETFFEKTLTPGDEVMLATWREGLRIVVPFTNDRASIAGGIEDIRKVGGGMNLRVMLERQDVERKIEQELDLVLTRFQTARQGYDAAMVHARLYADQTRQRSREMARGIDALMKTLAGVESRKAFVFVSASFPTYPGREYFLYLDEKLGSLLGARKPPIPAESLAGSEADLQTAIARTANAFGITFYGISATPEMDTSSVEKRYASERLPSVEFAAFTNTADALVSISNATGGRAMIGGSNYLGALAQVANDMSAYYSLGYRPTDAPGKETDIEVTVRRPGLRVRTRRSTVVQTRIAEISARVTGNLLQPDPKSDFSISAAAGKPRRDGRDLFSVPVEVRIPAAALTLLAEDNKLKGGIRVFVGGSNRTGAVSDVTENRQAIEIPIADRESLAEKFWTYELTALVRHDQDRLSIGVLDEVGGMTAFAQVEIPSLATN
jgi:VWFA-related protein